MVLLLLFKPLCAFTKILYFFLSVFIFKVEDRLIWMTMREDYNRLHELTKSVDDALSNVILLTYLNNIFILTMQLFQMLRWNFWVVSYHKNKKKSFCRPVMTLQLMSKIYFSYSFIYLLTRIIMMSIIVAKVDIVAKEPVEILSSLPYYIYNDEVVSNLSDVINIIVVYVLCL